MSAYSTEKTMDDQSDSLIDAEQTDPVCRAMMRGNCFLRSYQAEALRVIYDAALRQEGGHFAVIFPRQSGKNETQAHLEAALMSANRHKGGNIIKIIPTEKNQGKISLERLAGVLSRFAPSGQLKTKKNEITCGKTKLRCLSASPNAAIVGATADLMLEVDEAQMIRPDKYDLEAAPMAASTNAIQVFWGTVWDDQTLLAREGRRRKKPDPNTFSRPMP